MSMDKTKEEILEIEEEIRKLPYHKGTEHHIGKMKAKLAILRKQLVDKSSGGGGGGGFAVRKQGDATVVLVGVPSVGKSTLLNMLTGAESKIGHYPFTTLDVIPGVMEYKGAKIQIFDVPGLIEGAAEGKGGGKEILSVVRVADLLLLMASTENHESFGLMEKELRNAGVRLNETPPNIEMEKKVRGGINIQGTPGLLRETVVSLAHAFRVMNAKITFREKVDEEQFIDFLAGNRAYVRYMKLLTKTDLINQEELDQISSEHPGLLTISAEKIEGIDELRDTIFDELRFIRIYLKRAARLPADKDPLICREGETVYEIAVRISQGMADEIKGAKIVGPSAKFENQKVGIDHVVQDGDQIFFIK